MRFVCFRDEDGRIDAFQAFLDAPAMCPLPVISGEDPELNYKRGLFRMIVAVILDTAMREGWIVDLGGGNVHFKRNRGGEAALEYKADCSRHLSAGRRLAMSTNAQISNRILVPVWEKLEA